MKKPLLSIIIPVYNNKKYLPMAVESVVKQEFKDWEIIIVDDGSTDGTSELVDRIVAEDNRIRAIHQDNQWIYASMNNGIAIAKGKYIYILNSDDRIKDNKLNIIVDAIYKYDEPDIIWSGYDMYICDTNQKLLEKQPGVNAFGKELFLPKKEFPEYVCELFKRNYLGTQANVYKTELMKSFPFRNDYYAADTLFNLEIVKHIDTSVVLAENIYLHLVYDKLNMNVSKNKYYSYQHIMINEIYNNFIDMIKVIGADEDEGIMVISNFRADIINQEIRNLFAPNCCMGPEDKIETILSYIDKTLMEAATRCNKFELVERSILRNVKQIIDAYPKISKSNWIIDLVEVITAKNINRDYLTRAYNAINSEKNVYSIGRSYYEEIKHRYSSSVKKKNKNAKRILWLCNIVMPDVCSRFFFKRTDVGGWIDGLWQNIKDDPDYKFAICVPIQKAYNCEDGVIDNFRYYSFIDTMDKEKLSVMQNRFEDIISDFNPDVIHIWGTEYLHTYAMILAAERKGNLKHVLIHMQGILSAYYHYFYSGLTYEMIKSDDLINSIEAYYKDFKNRAKYEKKAISKVYNILGRTSWDKCWAKVNSKKAKYYNVGEILRSEMYENSDTWDVNKCRGKTIFISQASYPIKGLHLILESISRLKIIYPELKVRIAGINPTNINNGYDIYLKETIKRLELENIIEFIGVKNAVEMIEEYRNANVYLSASTIENSPNSLCEAMLIGTPVVCSDVGGVSSLVDDGIDGFLYPINEMSLMEYYVQKLFEDKELAKRMSKKATEDIAKLVSKERIVESIKELYDEIGKECEG